MEFSEGAPVLQAIGMAEASDRPIQVEDCTGELGVSEGALANRLDALE